MTTEACEQFRDAMRAVGLNFAAPLIADGKIHRFKTTGDRRGNSWYVLHDGEILVGVFGCWKRGINEKWCERSRHLSSAELKEVHGRWERAEREREQAEIKSYLKAKKIANWILSKSSPVESHPYLSSKMRMNAIGLRQYRRRLVLGLYDVEGCLHSLQFISANGSKRFLRGGRVVGCFFMLFEDSSLPLVICEGYATGASIYAATGFAVACAMNSGNLHAVAKTLRDKWPTREIIVAADNDQFTDGNPGLAKATEAAKAISARLAIPQFKDNTTQPTDYNDLATLEGTEEVKRQIETAQEQPETDEEILQRLAALSPLDYERKRKSEAQRLSYRVSVLDELVTTRRIRPDTAEAALQGHSLDLADAEPWPESVNGSDLLTELEETFTRYIVLANWAATILALWCAHAHVFDVFDCSPRLNISSPEKRCGKTTLRDLLEVLVPRALATENLTVPVLFRVIEAHKPTLLADECDAWLKDNDELRGMLNSGHRRGGKALRCEGEKNEVRAFQVFGPAVLCGIGALPSTLHDRSIKVSLERAQPGEVPERFDLRRTHHERELQRKLARFCSDHREALEGCDPVLPPGAFNRLADNWRPLCAIAEVVGGHWPQRAAAAFASLLSKEDADQQGIGVMLLTDIKQIFEEAEAERLFSKELTEKLTALSDRPWPEAHRGRPITETWLAKRLRPFGVLPKTIRIKAERLKGYELVAFSEAFARYVSDLRDSPRDAVTSQRSSVLEGESSRDETIEGHGLRSQEGPVNIDLSPCHTSKPADSAEVLMVGEI